MRPCNSALTAKGWEHDPWFHDPRRSLPCVLADDHIGPHTTLPGLLLELRNAAQAFVRAEASMRELCAELRKGAGS